MPTELARSTRWNAASKESRSISWSPEIAGMSGPTSASAGAKMCKASPKASANRPTDSGVESQVRKKTSLRESTSVPMMLASPVGSAKRQNPEGKPRGRIGRGTAER